MDTGKFTLEQCATLSGIPEKTVAHYITLASEFFIAKRKQESMDKICGERGIGNSGQDPRENYYMSPYHQLAKKGFINPENMGTRLAIDEINLSGEVYTILSNPEKNTIVGCVLGIKAKEVVAVLGGQGGLSYADRLQVKEITLDMSASMNWIAMELFPQAIRILDRFHVTQNVLEDVQAIRTRIKTAIKAEELTLEEQCQIERIKYVPRKLMNGETRLDCLTRVRYQLFKRRKDWNDCQIKRWETMQRHEEFLEIIIGYTLLEKFYEIYDSHISSTEASVLWNQWFQQISRYDTIQELQNPGRTIKNHLTGILHYFNGRYTNAFAEGLHSRIRRLISNSRGFKDKDYMLYRIMRVFG